MKAFAQGLVKLARKWWNRVSHYRYQARIDDLIARGLVLGSNVTIAPTAYVDSGFPYLIRIGDNCSVANNARLLAHDATTYKFTGGCTRLGKIVINDNCFIGENAIILPGVTIGPNVLIAAGSVVNRDIPPNSCVAGVPARVYAKFDAFIERHKQQLREREVFEFMDLRSDADGSVKRRILQAVQDGDAYVRGAARHAHTLNIQLKEDEIDPAVDGLLGESNASAAPTAV